MGHYLEISEYKELFNRYNMTFEIIEDTFNDYNKDNVLREIDVIKNTREEKCNSINDKFKKPVDEAVQKYLSRFNDISSSEDMLRLVYGAPFWKVIVKKR